MKWILFWVVLGYAVSGSAQVITLTDKESGEPLELVSIFSEDPNAFALTNAQGKADISAFKGAQKIGFSLMGYVSIERSYTELEQAGFALQLERSVVSLEAVVVSAGKKTEQQGRLSQRIALVSPRTLMWQNPQTAADLLGASGEVFIQKSQQGGGSPMIRGFSANRLLYSVDGVRMNTAIFRAGNLQNVISLDPFAIEQTEVLFGPASVMYGSDAIGGVMAFRTLTPQFALGDQTLVSGKSVFRYSSANREQTAHFSVNLGWKRWAAVTSFSSNRYGHLMMGSKGPEEYLRPSFARRFDTLDRMETNPNPRLQVPTAYDQYNLMQKIRFRPNKNWDLLFAFHYAHTGENPRYDRLIRYKDGMQRSAEWYYGPQVWMMNQLSIRQGSPNLLYDEMYIRLAQQQFSESRIDRDWNNVERYRTSETVNAFSLNLDLNRKLFGAELSYGLEGVYNGVESKGEGENIADASGFAAASRYPQSTWISLGAYVTLLRNWGEKCTGNLGIRYSRFRTEADFTNNLHYYPLPVSHLTNADGAITGSAGMVYHPAKNWTLNLNLATGFRAPNVDDLGKVFDSEPGAVVVPNPSLKAEYALNGEIGVAALIRKKLKTDLSAYYTLLENALVRRDFTLNGLDSILYAGEMSRVQAIQNAALARVYGIQFGFELDLGAGFGINSRLNIQIGEEELDDGTRSPSRHAAPWFGLSRLSYTHDRLSMQFYAVYSGGKTHSQMPEEEKGKPEIYAIDANGNPYSPGWYTLNLKCMYRLGDSYWVSAGMENLTDQRYKPFSSGLVAPGRNMVVSLRLAFY